MTDETFVYLQMADYSYVQYVLYYIYMQNRLYYIYMQNRILTVLVLHLRNSIAMAQFFVRTNSVSC